MAEKSNNYYLFTALLFFLISQSLFASDGQEIITDTAIIDNWISVQSDVHAELHVHEPNDNNDSPPYDRLADKFYNLFINTGDNVYINFALHEAGRNKRDQIIESLSPDIRDSLSQVINKLSHNQIDDDYFNVRSFSTDDIYSFIGIEIPPKLEENAEALLEYWYENLPDTDNKLRKFKIQALIHGYYLLGQHDKVVEINNEFRNEQPFPPSYFTLNLFNQIAFSARVGGYYRDALVIYRDILIPLTEYLNNEVEILYTKMDYANVLFRIGNVSAAKSEYELIHSTDTSQLIPSYQSALFNNLAISYLNSGNFEQYVEFQLNAYDIAKEQDNFSQQLTILRNLFNFYRRQGETTTATNYINQALELAREQELEDELPSLLIPYGIHLREAENNLTQSESELSESLNLAQNSNDYRNIYNSHIQIAMTYEAMNNYESAINHFLEARDLSIARDDEPGFIEAEIWLANLYTTMDDYDGASKIINTYSESDFYKLTFEKRVLANNIHLKLLEHRGELSQAVELSDQMISEIIGWLRESSDQQTGHMRMDDQFSEAFRLHTNLMFQSGEYENALATIGELRNISRSGFYNNPLLKSNVLNDEELIYDYALGNRIQRLRNNISEASEQERITLNNELLTAINERNRLLSSALPRVDSQQFEQQLTSAQQNLERDQAIFFFSVFEDQIFRFIITRSDVNMKVYPYEDQYINQLKTATATLGRERTNLVDLYNIYTTFFETNLLSSIDHIYMIPDDDFYRLPIEILPTEPVSSSFSYGSANYLLEKYSVSYANSLSDLIRDDESSSAAFENDIAGFGIRNFKEAGHTNMSDLPFSPREIKQSVESLDRFANKTFFLDEESTRENFIKNAGNSRILHVATHSQVNDDNPLFSSMYLYPASDTSNNDSSENSDNGILHAYELFDLNINAELVFLSSCESGSGGYLQGAGVLGFSRALSYAGAKSLLMNLWPVRDQTASTISLSFYNEINNGANKADALRSARLDYLNTTNSDPYLWGTFVLYGDINSPLPARDNNWRFALFTLLIIGLITFGFVTFKKLT